MLNVFLQCGLYRKIYDSYKHDDVYGALYQINMGLSDYDKNNKRMKEEEYMVKSLEGEHVRIYVDVDGHVKQVMVKKSNKLVLVKWFMMRCPEEIDEPKRIKHHKHHEHHKHYKHIQTRQSNNNIVIH